MQLPTESVTKDHLSPETIIFFMANGMVFPHRLYCNEIHYNCARSVPKIITCVQGCLLYLLLCMEIT